MKDAFGERRLRVGLHCRALATRFGGMERTVVSLGNHLASIGWEVCLFYNANKGAPIVYPAAADLARCPIEGGPNLPERFAAEAEAYAPDVNVFFYADASAIPFVVALSGSRIPLVLHEGTNPERLVVTNWAERLGMPADRAAREREALAAMATRVRVTLPSYIDSFGPLMKPHVVSFPNAFPPAAPETEALRKAEPRKRFIHIGGLKKNKNLLPALEAFALIAGTVPEWDFALFSDEPPRANVRPEAEAFIRRSGLGHRIVLHPPTQDIFREYGRSHCHVISSLSEGLPNCVAEAMRHALPSIGYDVCSGTNELIVHGVNGLLADAADPVRSLADRMLAMARDDEARARMGRKALEDSAMFDGEAVMANWRALLREAASYKGDPERLERERRAVDAAGLKAAERIQRSAFLAPPQPARAEPGEKAVAILMPPGASPEEVRGVRHVLGAIGGAGEVRLAEEPAAPQGPPNDPAIGCAAGRVEGGLGKAGAPDYLLCLSPGPHDEADLRRAVDFAMRTRREGADVGLALSPSAGAPPGLTTFARAGTALFAEAPACSVWRTAHLREFAIRDNPHACLPAALLAAATAAAILVDNRGTGTPSPWSGRGAPDATEVARLREDTARRLAEASVEALCPSIDAVLLRHWVFPTLGELFERDRIDYDEADRVRALAALLADGAADLVRTSVPDGVAVLAAALGYYPWVRAALRKEPLPRQVLATIDAALSVPARRAIGGGGVARRWGNAIEGS